MALKSIDTQKNTRVYTSRGPYRKVDPSARFWSKVYLEAPAPTYCPDLGECWVWTGALNENGYGIFRINGKNVKAHRWIYEFMFGSILELEVDHLCRVRSCVRPSHLEAVTHQENDKRGLPGGRSWRRERTHCKNNHEFTPDNCEWLKGGSVRGCKKCHRERSARAKK